MRKQKAYIYHIYFEIATFLKTGVYIYIYTYEAQKAETVLSADIYIYIYITNCRQYCFGLLGLISAVLMSGMEVKLIKPPQMSHTCGTSKPCQSAQTSDIYIYIYIYIYIIG